MSNWRNRDDRGENTYRGRTFSNRNAFPRHDDQQNDRRGQRYDRYNSSRTNNFETTVSNDADAFASWGVEPEEFKQESRSFGRRGNNPNDVKITIEIPSDKVGKVIGRGGSKIRELQDETNTNIKIRKDEDVNGTTKVDLSGSESDVQNVQKLIEKLTSDYMPRGNFQNNRSDSQYNDDHSVPVENFDWAELGRQCQESTKLFWSKLPEIVKNFYIEDSAVANMSSREVEEIRQANNNTTVAYIFEDGGQKPKIPHPVRTFEQCFKNYPEILEGIRQMGFEQPSPIQAQAWPILLSGKDMIGIAQTGTGKTLAFLLPALLHIEGQTTPRSERSGPTVLVIAPTRELAQQIEREVIKYNYKDMKAVCLYGGGNRKEQAAICTQGVEIVIATPGRLSDLTVAGYIDLKSVSYLVLDEADRMLDLGFEPQIRKILLDIRPNRQTVMTSATWPPGVRQLAKSYTQDPIQVCVGTLDLAAVHSVTQTIVILDDDDQIKYKELGAFLRSMDDECKVIVFCGKKARVNHLASELTMEGVDCQTIHGDLEQVDREQALADISSGAVRILIATDVASRGIDISDITHVINYDFPRNVEEYVHRVGRTGRAGRTGESISFVTRGDWANSKELIAILEEANQPIPQELYSMSTRFEAYKERRDKEREMLRGSGGGGGRGGGRFGGRGRW